MAERFERHGPLADVRAGNVGDRIAPQADPSFRARRTSLPNICRSFFDLFRQVIKRCKEAGVESVYDVMDMESDVRNKALQMDNARMCVYAHPILESYTHPRCRKDVAAFVNSYPTLEVNHELVKGDYTAGTPLVLKVTLSRDADDEDENGDDQLVIAPYYPGKKMANWWLVVGEPSTKQLLSIKRVTVNKNIAVKLEFTLQQGRHDLKLSVICDSYMGADHDILLDPIDVAEGESSDEDSSGDEDMEE